ncbi:hypothetical protein RFI_00262 [Reticulomyxa filosa]|uniref:Uncharacterized protein n=1 Tax=Reticulomyxa filosa TaxID=46433 RepID=X6PE63_RETFI|nr:hypothetical protein RFI_00262 [Reticulomyxa filosa]|eukprot:ETO36800.1 hypothetical protein RFI_00262 [Reticulomyxa filosa]
MRLHVPEMKYENGWKWKYLPTSARTNKSEHEISLVEACLIKPWLKKADVVSALRKCNQFYIDAKLSQFLFREKKKLEDLTKLFRLYYNSSLKDSPSSLINDFLEMESKDVGLDIFPHEIPSLIVEMDNPNRVTLVQIQELMLYLSYFRGTINDPNKCCLQDLAKELAVRKIVADKDYKKKKAMISAMEKNFRILWNFSYSRKSFSLQLKMITKFSSLINMNNEIALFW